jgi:hypothetical protein
MLAPWSGSNGAGAAPAASAIQVTGDWKVTFTPPAASFIKPASAAPSASMSAAAATVSTNMKSLHSWTDDEATRFFSGTASYETQITLTEAFVRSQPGRRITLGFGDGTPVDKPASGPNTPSNTAAPVRQRAWIDSPVREAAVVYVNDKRAGAVWAPPYGVDVTGLLVPGVNRIRVIVGNTAINYMAGRPLPSYRLLNLRYGERFTPQDMSDLRPLPSGLLQPITLSTLPRY